MRRAARTDDNQPQIVRLLREKECSVEILAPVGKGVPDLLVGCRGINFLMEIKDPTKPRSDQELTPAQLAWHLKWKGRPPVVVRTWLDALAVISSSSLVRADWRVGKGI